jgi:hypothetical protein
MRPSRSASLLLLTGICAAGPACHSTPPNQARRPAAFPPASGLVFTGRRPDGGEIALSDRTKWAIQPAGASATLHWQPGEPLQMGASGEPLWPAAITSLASGATAYARPAGHY